MRDLDRRLSVTLASADVCTVLAVSPAPTVVRALAAAPILFALPGYGLVRAVFAGQRLDAVWLGLLSLGLSLVADCLLALALDVLRIGIHAPTIALSLLAVTTAAVLAAHVRSRAHVAQPLNRLFRRPAAAAITLIAVATAATVGSVVAAIRPLPARVDEYTALAVAPTMRPDSVRVSVVSGETDPQRYRIVILSSRRSRIIGFDARVAPGGRWQRDVNLGPTRVATVRLYRAADLSRPFRTVWISLRGLA